MQQKLTDAVVARLKPPAAGKLDVWDTTTRSFGVRLFVTGQRSWIVGLRRPGSAHGCYALKPADMKLKDARAKARAALDDPAAFFAEREKTEQKAEQTFKALAEEFLAHGRTKRGRTLRPATLREYGRSLRLHAKPLHPMPVTDIHRADVASLFRKVATKHGEVSAMRTRAALSRFWSWLVAGGARHVEFNVVTGTEGYDTPKRSRVLTDDEIRALWTATEEPTDFNLILRVLLWTGCRRAEAAAMRWSELNDGVWTVPGSRTKNHRPLVLPLPRQALAALEAHPEFVRRDFLFGRGPVGFNGVSKCLERMRDRLGFAEQWGPHDLRRTVQTRMAGLGIAKDVANKVLNHATGPIDEAYDLHAYEREKAHALQKWADALDRITGPEHDSSNVTPLRKSA